MISFTWASTRMSRFLVLVALAITLASMLLAVSARPAAAAEDMLVGLEQNGGMDQSKLRAENLATMQALGSQVIRFVLRFDRVATCDPRTKPQGANNPANPCYNWAVPDAVVKGATNKKMWVILSVVGTPKFVFGNSNYGYVGNSEAEFNKFNGLYAQFSEAAAKRYSGKAGMPRVQMWTVWNEPNSQYFFKPQKVGKDIIAPRRYARMYAAASRKIKGVDSTFLVAAGPTSSGSTTKPGKFVPLFLKAMRKSTAPIDAWAHNPYLQDSPNPEAGTGNWRSPSGHFRGMPYIGLSNMNDLYKILDTSKLTKGLPVWSTEFSYETNPDPQGVTMDQQAEWMAEATYVAWRDPRMKIFIWYGLFDDGDGSSKGFQSGLYRSLGTCAKRWCPKPGASMFRNPTYVSATTAKAGESVTVWGQGRMDPTKTKVYVWEQGATGWQPFTNTADMRGSLWVTWQMRAPTWFVTCDTACGPIRYVKMA